VKVASADICTTYYEFREDDKTLYLYYERELVAIVHNIMDIEDVGGCLLK